MAEKAQTAAKPGAKKPQSRAEREEDRRRVILRAAVEVFSRKGYHGCRIQDVAKEAGVAYGLVYHYFKNKDELLESVFASGWQNFLGRVQAEIASDQHVSERVRGIVHVAFEAYRRDPRGVKVLILEVGRSPAGGAVNRGGAFSSVIIAASQMFVEAQRRGEIPAHLEPTLCATMLFGSIEMGLTSFVMGLLDKRDDEAIDRAREQVAEHFLNGLTGARPQRAPLLPSSAASRARSRTTS